MALLEECKTHFQANDLYSVLGVDKSVSAAGLKKAYYKVSLSVHPDRVGASEKTAATQKFQILGKVFSILSNEGQRKMYDETGGVDDDEFDSAIRDWFQYWQALFKKVTIDDIVKLENDYKGSAEETEDIRKSYLRHSGNLSLIMDDIMFVKGEDEERIVKIINDMIDMGDVKGFKAFLSEPASKKKQRQMKFTREAAEVERMTKAKEKSEKRDARNESKSLTELIQQRNSDRAANMESFFDQLEKKYAKKGKEKAGKQTTDVGATTRTGRPGRAATKVKGSSGDGEKENNKAGGRSKSGGKRGSANQEEEEVISDDEWTAESEGEEVVKESAKVSQRRSRTKSDVNGGIAKKAKGALTSTGEGARASTARRRK